jgi:hypothetical protein
MSFSFGDEREAVEYARKALDAYGPGHVQIYHLAKDVAWFWMDHYGNFESAARVLMALTEHVWNPAYRVLLLANLGRAASGAGWVELFEGMWVETWALVRQQVSRQGHAAALVQLAQGAGNLGQWERSGFAAAEALSIARERKEAEVMLAAEAIVEALGHGVIRDETVGNVFKDRARMTPARAFQEVDELTIQFAEALRARRDNAPESPTRALVYPGAD